MQLNDIGIVIPVREGSSRISQKVVRPFINNKSLTEWKIEQLLQFFSVEQIYVSTNSEKIKNQVAKYGVRIHERNRYLSVGHQAPFYEVITGIVRDIPFEHIAWVTVVVPLMTGQHYLEAFEKYIINEETNNKFDSLVTVNLVKEYLWYYDRPLNYEANKNHTISQNLPDIYRVTNGLYMRNVKDILRDEYFLGPRPYFHVVDKFAGIDIDEMDDFKLAQVLAEMIL